MRGSRHRAACAVGILRHQMMPKEEISAILSAHDSVIVHRYLELHQERLDEWVAEQRRVLASLERSLTDAIRSSDSSCRGDASAPVSANRSSRRGPGWRCP